MAELNRVQSDLVFDALAGYSQNVYAETLAANDYAIKTATATKGIWTRHRLTIPDGQSVPYLQDVAWRFHSVRVPVDDPGVTYSGLWYDWAGSNGLEPHDYKRSSNAAGDYAEWVSPASSGVAVFTGHISVGGLSKIYVDGDSKACNGLATAQDMVDQGWYANTILVANGGTLDPDDRVINHSRDGYEGYLVQARGHLVAYGLPEVAHTVRVECTGYDSLYYAAGSPRTYLWGFGVICEPDAVGASEYWFREGARVLSANPTSKPSRITQEYAIRWAPDEVATGHWSGQSHSNENFVSLAVTANTATSFQLTRNTQLTNPDGVGTYCDVQTVFTWNQGGLTVASTFTWTQVAYMKTVYLAMQTLYGGNYYEYNSLEKLRGSAEHNTEIINSNDEVEHLVGEALTMWMYGGNFVAALRVTDDHVIGAESRIWDRSHSNNQGYDKTYIARHVGAANVPVAVNEVWNSTAHHRFTFDPLGAANTAEKIEPPTEPYLPLASDPTKWIVPAEGFHRKSVSAGIGSEYSWVYESFADIGTSHLGPGYMRVLPDDGVAMGSPYTNGPKLHVDFYMPTADDIRVWIRGRRSAVSGSRVYLSVDGVEPGTLQRPVTPNNDFDWISSEQGEFDGLSAGLHTLDLTTQFAGTAVDHILITTDQAYDPNNDKAAANALPLSLTGPAYSPNGENKDVLGGSIAMVFNPINGKPAFRSVAN